MSDLLVRVLGWKATVLHGDPQEYARWKWLRERLNPGPHRLLDAGCGSGAFTMAAALRGNQALGVSFDERNNGVAERRAKLLGIGNIRFRTIDLRQLDAHASELGTFDEILCSEVIEHVRDDRKLLRDLVAMLRPGGRLLLTTPNKEYVRMVGDVLSTVEDGGHVRWGYTHEEIRELLDEVGVRVVEEGCNSGFVPQQLANLTRLIARVDARLAFAVVFPLRVFTTIDGPLTRLLRYPYFSITVVGIKQG